MGYYLDKLIDQAEDLILLSNDRDVNDTFCHLRKLWQQSKAWFDIIVADSNRGGDCALGRPELNFMEILPSVIDSCVDFSGTLTYDEKLYVFLIAILSLF